MQTADLYYANHLSAVIYMQKAERGSRSLEWFQIQVKVQLSEPRYGLKPPSVTLELNEEVAEQNRQIGRERYLWRGSESRGGNKKRAPKQDTLVRERREKRRESSKGEQATGLF